MAKAMGSFHIRVDGKVLGRSLVNKWQSLHFCRSERGEFPTFLFVSWLYG